MNIIREASHVSRVPLRIQSNKLVSDKVINFNMNVELLKMSKHVIFILSQNVILKRG